MAKKPLKADETRMARWDQMTAAEKARVRAKEKAALKEAEGERKRPLLSRIADGYVNTFGSNADAKSRKESARRDISEREGRYQSAKKRASRSDKDRTGPMELYGVDRVLKMAKGGSVSKRADGCAVKGKTRGKMV